MNERIDIKHIAKLSRLELSDEELEKYGQQLTGILRYVGKLNEIQFGDSDRSIGIKGSSSSTSQESVAGISSETEVGIINGVTDAMREDEAGESLNREEALKNAPTQKDGFIQVKAVFAEGEQ